MKKLLFIGSMLFMSSLCAGQYVGVHGGANHLNVTRGSNQSLKMGYKVGLTCGYAFDSSWRAELQCSYFANHYGSSHEASTAGFTFSKQTNKLHTWAYMANILYDIKGLTFSSLYPYLGAGVGYAQNSSVLTVRRDDIVTDYKGRDNRFAYQLIAGAMMPVNEQYSTALEYNFHSGKAHGKDHSVQMHLIRNF